MKKLLRTIRFDDTDDRVYDVGAPAGEWAVSGGFAFSEIPSAGLIGKTRQAFANGFLGLGSFGRSTFATVGEVTDLDLSAAERCLADHLVARYGAPDLGAAVTAAREELAFATDLCQELATNMVLTVRRMVDDEGRIKEEFRTIRPPSGEPQHARVWTIEREADDR